MRHEVAMFQKFLGKRVRKHVPFCCESLGLQEESSLSAGMYTLDQIVPCSIVLVQLDGSLSNTFTTLSRHYSFSPSQHLVALSATRNHCRPRRHATLQPFQASSRPDTLLASQFSSYPFPDTSLPCVSCVTLNGTQQHAPSRQETLGLSVCRVSPSLTRRSEEHHLRSAEARMNLKASIRRPILVSDGKEVSKTQNAIKVWDHGDRAIRQSQLQRMRRILLSCLSHSTQGKANT